MITVRGIGRDLRKHTNLPGDPAPLEQHHGL